MKRLRQTRSLFSDAFPTRSRTSVARVPGTRSRHIFVAVRPQDSQGTRFGYVHAAGIVRTRSRFRRDKTGNAFVSLRHKEAP